MPLYYTDKSLEEVEKKRRARVSPAERKRRQDAETQRFEAANPELKGQKRTRVGAVDLLVDNPTIAGSKTTGKKTGTKTSRTSGTRTSRTSGTKTDTKTGGKRGGKKGKREIIPTPEGSFRVRGNKFQKISGKKGKGGQKGSKKIEDVNARNAGRNILGTAGGSNPDPWSSQSRGAGRKGTAVGRPIKIKKTLDNLQGQLQGMLAVLKTHKIDTSRGAFQSAIPDKDEKTRRRKDLKRQRNVGADKKVSEGMSYISEVKRSLDNQIKALIKSYKA